VTVAAGSVRVGIDAIDVHRFRRLLARRPSVGERLFTVAEHAVARGRGDPAPRLAARFAAKEAAMKVLGVGIGAFGFHDVEVERLDTGRPRLTLRGTAAGLAREQGIEDWEVSLTHTDDLAQAVVIGVVAPSCPS
jgi:phosphopantetheine--protein transferase-like protein